MRTNRINNLIIIWAVGFSLAVVSISGCSEANSSNELEALTQKRDSLVTLQKEIKEELTELNNQIMLKGGSGQIQAAVLVSSTPVVKGTFAHFVEMSGAVESRKNVLLSAEHMGVVTEVTIREGDKVRKGQVLVRQDASTLRNQINETQTSLELADAVYTRQKALWDKKIGTEVQYLEAKNRVASLKSRLSTLESQLSKSVIRAPFNGTIDKLEVKLGEMLSPGVPVVRLVNHAGLYINSDVSEAYIGKFQVGDTVEVEIPSYNLITRSKITSVGQVINPENRTFVVEVDMPDIERDVKPNLLTVLTIRDYENKNALMVPTQLIQKDNVGNFVYVIDEKESAKVAVKKHVVIGLSYDGVTEILKGLEGDEILVEEGYRDVKDGTTVKLD